MKATFQSCILALLLLCGLAFRTFSQSTVTFTQQIANYYANVSDGGGTFNNGGTEVGIWAHGGNHRVATWRKLKTNGDNTGSDRAMQIGDKFTITVAATRVYGRLGCALLASPSSTSTYADRENNYAISFNMDGPDYTPDFGFGYWYVKYNGDKVSASSIQGVQGTYHDYKMEFTLTAADRMNVTITDLSTSTSNSFYDVLLNNSNPITDYCIYFDNDWDGGANRNAYWKQTTTMVNTGAISMGQSNNSFSEAAAITNGLQANSTSSSSANTFTKIGSGTVTLNVASSFTGNTTVSAGVLAIGGDINSSSNITVNSGATLRVAGDVTLGTVTVNSGGLLEVMPGKSLTISSSLNNNAGNTGVILRSDATGTATILANVSVSGTVEQYLKRINSGTPTSDDWHLISSPVSNLSINSFVSNASNSIATSGALYAFGGYNTANSTYGPFWQSSMGGNLDDAIGYQTLRTTSGVVSFAGNMHNGTINVNVVGSGDKWNLIGNPFPCAINGNSGAGSNNFLSTNLSKLLSGFEALYYWDPSSSSYKPVNQAASSFFIAPNQGFFVKAASSTNITFDANMRTVHSSNFYKSGTTEPTTLKLLADFGDLHDWALLCLNDNATLGMDDGYDALTMNAFTPDKSLSTAIDGYADGFAIQSVPVNQLEQLEVPVNLKAPAGVPLTISAETTNLDPNIHFYLEDREKLIFTEISLPGASYTFVPEQALNGGGRLYLTTYLTYTGLGNRQAIFSLQTVPMPSENAVRVIGPFTPGMQANIFDCQGRIVSTIIMNHAGEQLVPVGNLPSGIYFIRMQGKNAILQAKFVWID